MSRRKCCPTWFSSPGWFLKSKGMTRRTSRLYSPPQHPAVLGLLPFRNHALHAEWETIDRTLVGSVLGLVQELLLKHFS